MIRFGLWSSVTSPPAVAEIARAMAEAERRALDGDARVKRAYLR